MFLKTLNNSLTGKKKLACLKISMPAMPDNVKLIITKTLAHYEHVLFKRTLSNNIILLIHKLQVLLHS